MTAWVDRLEQYEREGFHEVPGRSSNPVILKWAHGAGKAEWVTDDVTPWCGIGLAGVFDEVGLGNVVPPDPAAAISWRNCGVECTPKPGAILVFPRPGGHHVTVIKSVEGDIAHCIGCNQGDAIKTSPFQLNEHIACRWPIKEEKPDQSRIIAAAERQQVDKAKAVGSTGSAPVVENIPPPPKGFRESVEGLMGDVTWAKQIIGGIFDFATFVGVHWKYVAAGFALYFLARTAWDSNLIKKFRTQDHQEGYTP